MSVSHIHQASGSSLRMPEAGRKGATPELGVVCHLRATNFFGGPEKQIMELSQRLPSFGWKVVVGSFREGRSRVELTERATDIGIPTFLIDTKSSYSLAAVFQLRTELNRHKVDVLITHGHKPNAVGWLATRFPVGAHGQLGRKVVHASVLRGYIAGDWRIRVHEAIDRLLLRRQEHIVCVSNALKRKMIGYGINHSRLHVVPNCVDCETQHTPTDLRKEFGLPMEASVAVAVGRLSKEKGQRVLVEAMRSVSKRAPQLYLVMIGSGTEESKLRSMIRHAGLGNRVILGGFRENALGCIAGADLLVNPSLTEGLPNVVLEAMALGTPVVATNVGGVSELIEDQRSGWLVPPSSPQVLANAIVAAISNPSRSREIAEAAEVRARRKFSFEIQAESWSHLIASWASCTPSNRARSLAASN